MQEVKVSVISKFGEKLVGYKTIPEGKKDNYPTVILVHGFASSAEADPISDIALQLTKAGFLTYAFSFSGRGQSDGDFVDTSLSKEVSELNSILEYIKEDGLVDIKNMGILAHSFGTAATICLNPNIKTIILASPSDNMEGFFLKRYANDFHPEGVSCWFKPSTKENICVGRQFWSDIKRYDLKTLSRKIIVPTLIIHGKDDQTILPNESESLYSNITGDKSRILIENADHKFLPNRVDTCKAIINWFNKYLNYEK